MLKIVFFCIASPTALDMQQCGISTVGAMAFQPVLKFNTTVSVLDLRQNPLIGKCDWNNNFNNCFKFKPRPDQSNGAVFDWMAKVIARLLLNGFGFTRVQMRMAIE